MAETTEQARREVKFGLDDFRRYFTEVATFPIIPRDVTGDPADYLAERALPRRHAPETACAISNCCSGPPWPARVLLLAQHWADWSATKKSYELMARYVHPHFQCNANELRDWSYDDAKAKFATAGMQSQAAVQAAIDKYQARKG